MLITSSRCLLAVFVSVASAPSGVALFDYRARETDELSVIRGEELRVHGLADGEDEWISCQATDGRTGLLPLSYVRLRSDVEHQPSAASRSSSAASAAVARAVAAAVAAAAASEHNGGQGDPGLREAMRRYRQRRAAYNGPPERDERWGVRTQQDALGSPELVDEFAPAGSASDGGSGGGGGGGFSRNEPLEHRSGLHGVPFHNLVEYMDDEHDLSTEIMRMLRAEWLAETKCSEPFLADLDDALQRAAAAGSTVGTLGVDGRDVILTFANAGYADFVLNGFAPAVVPNTLVIALDETAHAIFGSAGFVSYHAPCMPQMQPASAAHTSAAFMDIMKLRLLYLAEVLVRGYNVLLTDADAVFRASPFTVFPPRAQLVVACDSTVVPRNWREAPGMVMAGFFYARAGVRPLILLKEVLDYQVRSRLITLDCPQ
jgi:hypothetical protein